MLSTTMPRAQESAPYIQVIVVLAQKSRCVSDILSPLIPKIFNELRINRNFELAHSKSILADHTRL